MKTAFFVMFIVLCCLVILLFIALAAACFYIGLCLSSKSTVEIAEQRDKIKNITPSKKPKPPDNKEIKRLNETLKLVDEYDGKPPVVRKGGGK